MTTPNTSRPRAFSPLIASYCRPLSELPPIQEPTMYDQARERVHTAFLCRTPIDPVADIRSPGLMKGNADLKPSTWKPRVFRECPECEGRGVLPRSPWAKEPGDLMCHQCKGAGTLQL